MPLSRAPGRQGNGEPYQRLPTRLPFSRRVVNAVRMCASRRQIQTTHPSPVEPGSACRTPPTGNRPGERCPARSTVSRRDPDESQACGRDPVRRPERIPCRTPRRRQSDESARGNRDRKGCRDWPDDRSLPSACAGVCRVRSVPPARETPVPSAPAPPARGGGDREPQGRGTRSRPAGG